MSLVRADIRDQAKALLVAAGTAAGGSVFVGRDWPTSTALFPLLLIWVPEDRKESLGPAARGGFKSNCSLVVKIRVTGGNPTAVELALDTLCSQVEQALMLPLLAIDSVQLITGIETESQVNASAAQQVGEAAIAFHVEYVEWFEPASTPLVDIRGTVTDQPTGQPFSIFDAPLAQP